MGHVSLYISSPILDVTKGVWLGPVKMTKENFQSLSKAADITLFTVGYEQFLDMMETLQGDSAP